MSCWEILLSKGPVEWDWLGDPVRRVQRSANPVCGWARGFLIVSTRCGLPVRSLTSGSSASATSPFPASSCSAPSACCTPRASCCWEWLPVVLSGYDAVPLGLAMSPSGVSSLAAMVLVGVLVGRGLDARWPIAAGLVVMAAGNYWMARMNLQISPWQVVGLARMVLTLGLGLLFAPISVAAYKYTPVHRRGAAVGLLSPAPAPRAAKVSARRWPRPFKSGANSFTWHA